MLNIKRCFCIISCLFFTSVISVLSSLYQKLNRTVSDDQQYQPSQDPEKSVDHYYMCIFPLHVLHNELASLLNSDGVKPNSLCWLRASNLQQLWLKNGFGHPFVLEPGRNPFKRMLFSKGRWKMSLVVEYPDMRKGKLVQQLK